jgi:hypothetical protein
LAFLKVNTLGLNIRDIQALASLPVKFLQWVRPNEKTVADKVALVFQGGSSKVPAVIDRLVKQINGTQS